MIGIVRRHVRRADGEEGIALVVAIALIGVVGMLIVTMVAVAMYESRASGRDRQRSQAVMAAEQSVDMLMAQIQGASTATLPCGTLATQPVSVVSDRLAVVPTVQYYDEAGNPLNDCATIRAGTTRAYSALISASATSEAIANQAPAVRSIEMLVSLEPEFANDMTKAIFGDAGVLLDNHAEIFGENGQPNADVYTNGNVSCRNNQMYHGSIYAQGSVVLESTCWVAVDVYAGTRFEGRNSGVNVNGRVMVAHGNAYLTNNMSIGQQVLVSGTVETGATSGPCATPNKCFEGAIVAPVPRIDFPIMNADDLSEWQAPLTAEGGGYSGTVVRFGPGGQSCTGSIPNPYNGKADWVGYQIALLAPTLTEPTIVVSHCGTQKLMFQGLDLNLKNNLVIFSDSGFVFSNTTRISSTDSGRRNLYLIQPYDMMGSCSGDGIALDNQVTVKPEVDVLLYSPCNIRKANNTTHYGQIYGGGQVTINNKLTMQYHPLPVFGVEASSTIESYSVEIDFKRENA